MPASPTPNAQIGAQPPETAQFLRTLQRAVAQSHDAIFITDAAGIISFINPAFEKLTGYSSLEAVGKDLSALTADGPHSEDYRAVWERILQQRPFSGALNVRHKSGERFVTEITITPVPGLRSQAGNLVCTCRGADAPASAQPDASEPATAKPEQVKEVVHALNNSLLTVIAQAELSFESLPREHPVRARMKGIQEQCRRAADLLRLLYELEQQPELVTPEPLHYQAPIAKDADVKAAQPATLKARASAAS